MRLPKPENWTLRTSERVLARLTKLQEQFESCTEINEQGEELNPKALEIEMEMLSLWDQIPVEDRRGFSFLWLSEPGTPNPMFTIKK